MSKYLIRWNSIVVLSSSLLVISTISSAQAATDSDLIKAYCGDLGGSTFVARTTGYYPNNSKMEGGFKDRRGRPLKTLQAYLRGDAAYVSIAMDTKAFHYGTKVMMPKLSDLKESKEQIPFRVVDTGGAFKHKGKKRIDICVENHGESLRPEINTRYTVIVCNGQQKASAK